MGIKVYPGVKRPSHHISLSDGVQTYGLRLADGPRSLQEIPMTPSTVHFSGGGTKFGDWEPGMSHIEQRTWEGGRANASLVDDPTRYFDGKMAWTLTPGKVFPAPMWKFGRGYLTEIVESVPGDIGWRAIYGSEYWAIAEQITHSSGWSTYAQAYIWVRKIGSPGDLYLDLYTDNSGSPGTLVASARIDKDDFASNEVCLAKAVYSAVALTGTTSWLVARSANTHDAGNHWEIGVDVDGGTGKVGTDGPVWSASAFSLWYRISTAVTDRRWRFFEFKGALYAVDEKANGTASKLYINGDRGKATSAAAAVIRDSNFGCSGAWATDQWKGFYIKITNGTGKGQSRLITSTNTVNGAIGVTPDFDITPDTTSEYVIYHTNRWKDISPSSGDQIDGVVKSVCVADDFVCFGQGQVVNILKMRWNPAASPPAHGFDDDGTNKADLLFTMFDATNDVQVYAANTAAATISRAAPTAWATNMSFGTAFDVGDNSLPIVSFHSHDGYLYAFKPDGRYLIKTDDTAEKDVAEIGFIKSENNGEAVLSHGMYEYFSWGGYALQRLYRSGDNIDLTNVGPDREEGLPADRRGKIAALLGTPPGILAAVDAGDDGYSSVLVLPVNGFGWHEVFRAWVAGDRVQGMYFQDSYRPRLWLSVGGELVHQDWPRLGFNPLKDSGMTYYPEAHLVSATIDMGVSRLPKFIKEISAAVENLSGDVEVQVDYQVNEDVGTDNWTYAGVFQLNPTDTLPVLAGEVYQMRYRLRLLTKDADVPPIVNATVVEGYARTPVKYQWNMRLEISSMQRDLSGVARDADPDEFMTWLKSAAVNSRRIYMRSIWEQMDGRYVVVEPPSLGREFVNNILGFWGGQVQVTVREV